MLRTTHRRHIAAVTLAVFCAAKPHFAHANDITWTGLTSTAFSDVGNWSPAQPTPTGDSLIFQDPGPSGSVLIDDYAMSVQSAIFNGSTGFTINQATTGTYALALQASATFSVLSSATQIWNGAITLAGNAHFNVAGNLVVGDNANPAGLALGALTSATNQIVTLVGGGTLTLGGTADANVRFQVTNGTLILNKVSTASAHASNSITLSAGAVILQGSGGDQISDDALVTINGGIFDLNGRSEGIAWLAGTGGTITNSVAGSNSLVSLVQGGVNSTFSGVVQDGPGTVGFLVKAGNAGK